MNTELFLAQKIRKTKGKTFSSTVITIGVASIAVGITAIILSFAILFGFKNTIKEKLFAMSSHIQVSKITLNQSYEEAPFVDNGDLKQILENNENVASINTIALKSAILKSSSQITGTLLKGTDQNYGWDKFENNLIAGRAIEFDTSGYANEIIISQKLQRLLEVELDDDMLIYFIQSPPRARKVKIVGIYETGIQELDEAYALVDIGLIRKINNWSDNEIGHYEVFLKDPEYLNQTSDQLLENIPQDLRIHKITELMPQFFDWFGLLDRNIVIVIFLIIVIAGFNMVSVLLIMIMERTPMIGLLKSVGAGNAFIQKIFVTNALWIVVKGLIIGNLIAVSFLFIQDRFKVIPLDPENYYMKYVPVEWSWLTFLGVNIGTFLLVGAILILPSLSIFKITPVKALKYKD